MLATLRNVLAIGLAVTAFDATTLRAQDERPDGERWFIDVEYSKLRPITITEGGRNRKRTFWYVVLKLTNKTGKDRTLDLDVRALTPQDKRNSVAKPGLYPNVVKAIAKKTRQKDLQNFMALESELADGASKSCVIVFSKLSKYANNIDVRVGGLTNTIYKEGKTTWRENTELSMRFYRMGDEYEVTRNKVYDKGKRWVTVKREKIRA